MELTTCTVQVRAVVPTLTGTRICVLVTDVGVNADLSAAAGVRQRKIRMGTANIALGPAMTRDEALRAIHGVEHALCIHRETCGNVAVLERDASFYACDHFVDAEHRIGSIAERSLADLASDPRMRAFGEAKRAALPRQCRTCDVLAFCNGGCPKDRFLTTDDGETGLNVLCAAYRRFFRHAAPQLERLSAHMKAGRRLREFRPAGPGT